MTSKERIQTVLAHKSADRIAIDFGATSVTGIHCKIVEELRNYYGLPNRPVKIIDAFQMLGEVDNELAEIIGIDTAGVWGQRDLFDTDIINRHTQTTPWGQEVLLSKDIDLTQQADGGVYIYAGGDHAYPPSAVMPEGCYFINAIERQVPIEEETLNPLDNTAEFGYLSDEDLLYFKQQVTQKANSGKAVVANFGGAALGDIAFIPGMGLKEPKGIRSVTEWYMSTALRPDYIHTVFEKQIDIAIANYQRLWETVGSDVDVVFTCGTDFGSQCSQFCSIDTFRNLWLPHYKRMNDWIHTHTSWKVFKHSCGAIIPILPGIIDAGFDIINPVQINAKDMDSTRLKAEFGADLTFWGGGIDTQKVLPFGTPEEVHEHILQQCDLLGKEGGFVFNAVHNIQANVPTKNVIAMISTLNQLNK